MKYIPIHSYCIFLAYLAYSVARHDWNFKRYQVQWSDETKKYIFGTREMSLKGYKGIKSTPWPKLNILLDLQCFVPIFLHVALCILSNNNWLPLLETLQICHGLIFHQDNDTKQTSKSTQKWILSLPPQSNDLNPKTSGVNWRGEAPTWISAFKHLERSCILAWSLTGWSLQWFHFTTAHTNPKWWTPHRTSEYF